MKPLLDVLVILDALEKEGSFAAASAKLFKTPSALSYTIHRLESDLNIQLLDRSGHRARFTPSGQMLLEKGRIVLEGLPDEVITEYLHRTHRRALAAQQDARADALERLDGGYGLQDACVARASVNGEPLRLTSLEYRLLHYMMMHQGRVISRTELVEHLYDQDFDLDSNTIEVFIGRVRKKVGPDRIETVRGLGYRLTPLPGETEAA